MKYCGHLFLFTLMFWVIIWMSSCAPTYRTVAPKLTFSHIRPIQLHSVSFQRSDIYVPSLAAPQVEHQMPTPLYTALDDLLGQMFISDAVGHYTLFITLENASVRHTKLPEPESIFYKFGSYPEDQYDFNIRVGYVLKDQASVVLADGYVEVKGRKTLKSDISPTGRDMAFIHMTEHIAGLLEKETRQLFQKKFPQIYQN